LIKGASSKSWLRHKNVLKRVLLLLGEDDPRVVPTQARRLRLYHALKGRDGHVVVFKLVFLNETHPLEGVY
jgi:dipeptidyl aminopeptidase/acylaminoacyl peptidase